LRPGGVFPAARHEVGVLVAPVVTLHRTLAGQRGVELGVTLPDALEVVTDLVLAQTLLRNLVANALKFARSRVEVEAEAWDGAVRFSVRDDGPGLPERIAAALRQDAVLPADVAGGLGLGLCVDIGRTLGTKLEVITGVSRGTTFRFVLPAAPAEPLPPKEPCHGTPPT
jgi:signal transduction histidine kinase